MADGTHLIQIGTARMVPMFTLTAVKRDASPSRAAEEQADDQKERAATVAQQAGCRTGEFARDYGSVPD